MLEYRYAGGVICNTYAAADGGQSKYRCASAGLQGVYSGRQIKAEVRGEAGADRRQRYEEKLGLIGGRDPYEFPKANWKDDVDLWPSTTYIHVGMYLVFSPSPYTGEDLLNYKSLECYQRFTAGWVRDILVSAEAGDRRILTAKVSYIWH